MEPKPSLASTAPEKQKLQPKPKPVIMPKKPAPRPTFTTQSGATITTSIQREAIQQTRNNATLLHMKLTGITKHGLTVPKGFNPHRDDVPAEEPKTVEDARRLEVLARQQTRANSLAQVQQAKALQEDPSIFEYDSVYDDMKGKKAGPANGVLEVDRTPRYLAALKAQAEQRQHFLDRALISKIRHESEKDKAVYGETDAYITASYKEHLKQNQRWMADEEERSKAQDHNTLGELDLTRFYGNLMFDRNEAFGGDLAARKAATESAVAALAEAVREDEGKNIVIEASTTEKKTPGAGVEEYERLLQEKEKKRLEEEQEAERKEQEEARRRKHELMIKTQAQFEQAQAEKRKAEELEREQLVVKAARRNTDDSISAAKARFLARKAQKSVIGPVPPP